MSRELTFHWNPAIRECPTLTYNIIASNCGICPIFTNHTTATCTDVPFNGSTCTFAIQIVVCKGIIENSSDKIRVVLNDGNQDSDRCTGAIISAVLFGGIGICVSIFTVVYVAITKKLKRTDTVKAQCEATGQQYEDINLQQSSLESDTIDTRKNVAYGSSTPETKAYNQVHVQQMAVQTTVQNQSCTS